MTSNLVYVNNNWLAIPLSADFRVFQFNITTFDYCKSKNYDLHYPPVNIFTKNVLCLLLFFFILFLLLNLNFYFKIFKFSYF